MYSIWSMCGCRRGELIRTGIKVAIVGRPNAGKSSLLNTLAARDAAIVSSMPGTTRDTVEVSVELAGQKVDGDPKPFNPLFWSCFDCLVLILQQLLLACLLHEAAVCGMQCCASCGCMASRVLLLAGDAGGHSRTQRQHR